MNYYENTGIMPIHERRLVEVDLTPEQIDQIRPRLVGKFRNGTDVFEDVEFIDLVEL